LKFSKALSLSFINPGKSGLNTVASSFTIGLTFMGENATELRVKNSSVEFEFVIPKNTDAATQSFEKIENKLSGTENYLTTKAFVFNQSDVAMHIQIKPRNSGIGYFFAIRVNASPVLNATHRYFNLYRLFCPAGLFFFCAFYNIRF